MNKKLAEKISFIPINGWFNKLTLLLISFLGLVIVFDIGVVAWEYGSFEYSCIGGSQPLLVTLYNLLANPMYCIFCISAWLLFSAMEYKHNRDTHIESTGYIQTVLLNRWAMYFYMLFFALPIYALLYFLLLVIKGCVLVNGSELWNRAQLAYRGQATAIEGFLLKGYFGGSMAILLLVGLKEAFQRW